MKKFSDFAKDTILDGEKAKLEDVLNVEIKVLGYNIKNSKYSKNSSGKYLTLQIERDNRRYVVFTGSDVLIDQLEKHGHEIPFVTTIRKINRYYSLT